MWRSFDCTQHHIDIYFPTARWSAHTAKTGTGSLNETDLTSYLKQQMSCVKDFTGQTATDSPRLAGRPLALHKLWTSIIRCTRLTPIYTLCETASKTFPFFESPGGEKKKKSILGPKRNINKTLHLYAVFSETLQKRDKSGFLQVCCWSSCTVQSTDQPSGCCLHFHMFHSVNTGRETRSVSVKEDLCLSSKLRTLK